MAKGKGNTASSFFEYIGDFVMAGNCLSRYADIPKDRIDKGPREVTTVKEIVGLYKDQF